jgi:para-nitrobenzyl esterase
MHPAVLDGALPAGGNEDCLYLNVFAPATTGQKKPVVVYFPGGGYMTSQKKFNCTNLVARTGMVYVVVQYRIGPFGFFASPAISDPAEQDVTARLGLLDQQQALRWVHGNIGSFGGDPTAISIWGQSAGGGGVIFHMTLSMKESWPFFVSVVAESPYLQPVGDNDTSANDGALRWKRAVAQGRSLIDAVGCGKQEDNASLARCLREVPADAVNSALKVSQGLIFETPDANWYPVFANASHFPMARFLSGETRPNTPILVGNNLNESDMLAEFLDPEMVLPANQGELERAFVNLWGTGKAAGVLKAYNASADGSHRQAFFAAVSDSVFNCPVQRIVAAQGRQHRASSTAVFQYVFDGCAAPTMGATHGAELPLVFAWGGWELSNTTRAISKEMVRLWSRFQRDGNPGPSWPPSENNKIMMIMRNGSFVVRTDSRRLGRCAVFAGI